jgi:hypothetical protein
LALPPGVLEIAYDGAPAISARALAEAADELELPGLTWQVIRRLAGRTVALGSLPGAPDPAWVLKIASSPDSVAFLRHGETWAANLATLAAGHRLLAAPDIGSWRLTVNASETRALAAIPFIVGTPLAPETRLDSAGVSALRAEIPTIMSVMAALEQLSYTPMRPRIKEWESHLRRRFERHVLANVTSGQLDELSADELRSAFRHHLGQASSVFKLAHGELTPWHILRTPDGQLALIDLDTMGYEVRHIDLSVLVMRIWGLQASPQVAIELFDAYLAGLTPRDREAFKRTTAWQWLFAGMRTLHEAQSWPDDTAARSFLTWCLARI